jgi:hypothetical protein
MNGCVDLVQTVASRDIGVNVRSLHGVMLVIVQASLQLTIEVLSWAGEEPSS